MSSDPHGAAAHDDDLDVSLDPATRRAFIIFVIVATLFVIGVATFVMLASEDPGPVMERIQDQRDSTITLLSAVFG
jgi:hypothetical protein